MPDADVAGASRGDLAWWAAQFRHYAETDPCCTAAGYLAAARRLDRAAAEPVEPLPAAPGQQETVDGPYGPVRPGRPGPYPPSQDVKPDLMIDRSPREKAQAILDDPDDYFARVWAERWEQSGGRQ